MRIKFRFALLAVVLALASCHQEDANVQAHGHAGPTLFTAMPASQTGVAFENNLHYTDSFNMYTYRNFYNGGGVGIGDINNDGLPDIFFCGNQQSNRLYLNKGNFQFEDITDKAGVGSDSVWSSGVSFVDINGDGLLDIYVCKSGDLKGTHRSNQLFINNGNLTFTEKAAEYGLNNTGLCTHAVFCDYDHDGDLDCYLLNNSFRSVGNYDLVKDQRTIPDTLGGNKLYRNDGGHFTDVTAAAGIYSSKIGFGLGVTIADIDKDGWPDIYVSNDFFERDYLYLNNHDGTFRESLEDCIRELSMNSMGADIADINNDGYPDIYVTDMLPEQESRVKTKTNFETWDKYQLAVTNGYYHQFVRNALQLNRGPVPATGGRKIMPTAGMGAKTAWNEEKVGSIDGKPGSTGVKTDEGRPWRGDAKTSSDEGNGKVAFSEISRMAGVNATDWSWGALITDLDNDGNKDIFVANGIYKDLTDQDYIQFMASPDEVRKILNEKGSKGIKALIDLIPSHPISNYAFSNDGDLHFTNRAAEWGLDAPGFSNGSAYADLDNDGALDLVVNNVNAPASIYRNHSREMHPENKYLKVILAGEGKNRFGIGAKVTLYYNHTLSYQEEMPMRGFESTVDSRLNFGLGKTALIDSLVVQWPDGRVQVLKEVKPNQILTLKIGEAKPVVPVAEVKLPLMSESADNHGIDFVHQENQFDDFERDRLIFHMLSTQGPRMAKGDVNGDGLEDIYICGAKDQPGAMYVQTAGTGKQTAAPGFRKTNEAVWAKDQQSEDVDATFFDADGDGDLDLFVCSGGNEFSPNSTALLSRLYLNDGKGNFTRSPQLLPSASVFESASCVTAADYDGDGDLDLFVGVRLKPFEYGWPCKSYILQNNGKGIFTDVTDKVAPALLKAGMVTDAKWFDYDRDGHPDLVVTGDYMPMRIFHNESGRLVETTHAMGLDSSNGWWNRIQIADIDGDGYPDIVAGNHGLNSRFKASTAKPVCMFVGDFDDNGSVEQIVTCFNGDSMYPMALRHDLVGVLPYLKKKYLRYADYKEQTMEDIFTKEQLDGAVKLNAYELRSCVFMNKAGGGFVKKPLPMEAQFSSVYGIVAQDIDGDGKTDLLLAGNFYESKPEVGTYDASYGLMLKGNGKGEFTSLSPARSGFFIKGAVRDLMTIKKDKKVLILAARNNDKMTIFQ